MIRGYKYYNCISLGVFLFYIMHWKIAQRNLSINKWAEAEPDRTYYKRNKSWDNYSKFKDEVFRNYYFGSYHCDTHIKSSYQLSAVFILMYSEPTPTSLWRYSSWTEQWWEHMCTRRIHTSKVNVLLIINMHSPNTCKYILYACNKYLL